MAIDPLMQGLLAGFAQEVKELAEKLTRDLLDLERETSGETLTELYVRVARGLHTLKGTAATVGLEEFSNLAHRMEDVLGPHREGGQSLPSPVTDALLKALDVLLASARSEADGKPVGAAGFQEVRALLDACAASAKPAVPPASPPPAAEAAPPVAKEAPEHEPLKESSEVDGTWRVSVRDVFGLMREVERLRELRLRLEQRRSELDSVLAMLRPLSETSPAQDRLATLSRLLVLDSDEAESIVEAAEGELKAIGTVPVRSIFEPLRRAARDLARQLEKQVNISLVGADVALDRRVLDSLRGPLLHIVRNAVDHGIESPEERVRRGKHREGSITLRVEQHGNVLFLTVEDDGDGIDVERVRDVALERGLVPAEQLAQMTSTQVQQLVFEPSFSTRTQVTAASGRGVGLDVVRSQVVALEGHIELQSTRGQGTRIVLTLPVEFGSSALLVVRAGEQQFGVPLTAIESVVRSRRSELRATKSRTQLVYREQPLPLFSLASLLGVAQPGLPSEGQPLLVLQAQGRRLALAVDEVLGDRDLVIRPLPTELRELTSYQGAATLADGELLLVLRTDWLVEQGTRGVSLRDMSRRALVVDDSLTARALHRTMLEAGGFTVHTASSGAQGLELLQHAVYDVVVCDIGMEEMDGYAFTAAVRLRPEGRALPIILVSAHDKDQDRQRGLAAGADGFLSKKECISGRLLSEVSALIGRRAAS